MNTNQDKSNAGDWLFLVGGAVLVGGYLGYENLPTINAWLMALQAPAAPQSAQSGGILAWLMGNWGLVLLIAAIFIAALRMGGNANAGTSEGGAIKHKSQRYVSVNLIR